ncbi:MAG TPA: tetratricopeptide repeat protein [Ignavibacteriales bacterium]|nr:tetratricopeptide repeat protein [Ignavibacteriales bacterium]
METFSYNHVLNTVAKLYEKGLYHQAIELLEELISKNTNDDDLNFKLGFLYSKVYNFEKAIFNYRKAVELKPQQFEYNYNYAIVLSENGNYELAIEYFNKALELKNNDINCIYNIGCTLKRANKFKEAIQVFENVLDINPNHAESIYNIGVIYYEMQEFQTAKEYFNRTIELNPEFPDAYWNLSLIYLREGNYKKGFQLYYWRWKTNEFQHKIKNTKIPFSKLEDLKPNTRVLISDEQGFGDTIQFIRLIPIFKEKYNLKIAFQCKKELYDLFKSYKYIDELYFYGQYIEQPDAHFALFDIATILQIDKNDIQTKIPYLFPTKKIKLNTTYKFNIGFCISGNPAHKLNNIRNIPIDDFQIIFENKNICFWNLATDKYNHLQKFENYQEPNFANFDQLASIINELDLIISVDTAVAHLAGALGKKVILLLPEFTDWRWELELETSPYYPTMQILRKKSNWKDLIFRLNDLILGSDGISITRASHGEEIESSNNNITNPIIDNTLNNYVSQHPETKTDTEIPKNQQLNSEITETIIINQSEEKKITNQEFLNKTDSSQNQKSEIKTQQFENDFQKSLKFYKSGNYQKVIEILSPYLEQQQNNAIFNYNYGLCLYHLNQIEKAIIYIQKAHQIDEYNIDIINTLTKIYIQIEKTDELKQIIPIIENKFSENFDKYFLLGLINQTLKNYENSLKYFQLALKYDSDNVDLLLNLGSAYFYYEDFENATELWFKVLSINPYHYQAYFNLGKFFEETKFYQNALELYLKVIAINPEFYDAQFSAAEMYLMLQDFEKGWGKYEYRKKLPKYGKLYLKGIEWKGENIDDKILLVYDEQGIGDSIQFVRYLKKITAYKILFVTRPELYELYKTANICENIYTFNQVDNLEYDYFVSLLSLPYIFNIKPDYEGIPYLKSDNQKNVKIEKYINPAKLNILLVPKSSGNIITKDLSDQQIETIIQKIDANILIYNYNPTKNYDNVTILNDIIETFEDTAAIISNVDLVICVDTAVAHLSGALGKETCLLLKYNADWRWFDNLNYSLFYKNFRIFRQKKYKIWDEPIDELISYINNLTENITLPNKNYQNFINLLDNNIEEANKLYTQYYIEWLKDYNKYPAIIIFLYKVGNNELADKLYNELKMLAPENNALKIIEAIKNELKNNLDDALNTYLELHKNNPKDIHSILKLSEIYTEKKDTVKAIEYYQKALIIEPNNILALNYLANLYQKNENYSQAEELYKEALALEPNNNDILYNYASLLQVIGKFNDAVSLYKQVIRNDFNRYGVHLNLATILLTQGNFVEGFEEYEYRRITPELKYKNFEIPYWNGENLNDKKILILFEQGYGDAINFVRFIKYLKIKYPNSNLTFAVRKNLITLLQKLNFIDNIIDINGNISVSQYDYYVYQLSLIKHFIDNIFDCKKDSCFGIPTKEIKIPEVENKLKIGICWRGSDKHKHTHIRNLPLEEFLFLTEIPYKNKYQIYSFQLDATDEEVKLLEENGIIQLKDNIKDFYDSYSFISKMDYLITVDTALLHLAGVNCKPKIYAYIGYFNDWRWLNGENPNIWYENLTLLKNYNFSSKGFLKQVINKYF